MRRRLFALALGAACLVPAARAGERTGAGPGDRGGRPAAARPSPEELVSALASRGHAERAAAFDALLARLVESERTLGAEAGRLGKLLAVKEGEEAPRVLEIDGEKLPRWALERKLEMVQCLAAELEAARGWTRGTGEKVNLERGVEVQVPNGSFEDYLPFLAQALGAEVALSPAAARAVARADLSVTGWATGRELLDWVEATFDLVPGMRDGKVVLRPRIAAEAPAPPQKEAESRGAPVGGGREPERAVAAPSGAETSAPRARPASDRGAPGCPGGARAGTRGCSAVRGGDERAPWGSPAPGRVGGRRALGTVDSPPAGAYPAPMAREGAPKGALAPVEIEAVAYLGA